MCRIGGRLRSRDASSCGVDVEIPPFGYLGSNLLKGHRLVGSLTGVVASKRVTEASKGALSTNGNRAQSILVEARLTERPTSRPGRKLGQSDPVALNGLAIAQRIKGTRAGSKGSAVRRLKWHASWVQNVVRQFGPYLLWA